jgi:hypothetical protein
MNFMGDIISGALNNRRRPPQDGLCGVVGAYIQIIIIIGVA